MKILILGDVMGRPARRAVRELVPSLIKNEEFDLVIANAENAAGGMGVDIKSAKELMSAGVNVLTSGNHIWKKKEIFFFRKKLYCLFYCFFIYRIGFITNNYCRNF